jgi:hypothetical protein
MAEPKSIPFEELHGRMKDLQLNLKDPTLEKDLKTLNTSKNELMDCLETFYENLHISLFKMCMEKPSIELKHAVETFIEDLGKKEHYFLEKEKNGGLNAEEKHRFQNKEFDQKKILLNEIVSHLEKPAQNQVVSATPTIIIKDKCFLSLQRILSDYLTIGFEEEKNRKILVDINLKNYFKNSPPENVLATINEQYKTVSFLNVDNGLHKTMQINGSSNIEIPYSPSILVTPDSKIYAIGGILLNNGYITNRGYRYKFIKFFVF